MGALVAGTAVAGGVAVCSADHVPSIDYGWSHHGLLASYDYAAYVWEKLNVWLRYVFIERGQPTIEGSPSYLPPITPSTTTNNSVRRGFQVYREVCASCHAMEHTYFRNLVGVTHSEEEVKKIAEAYDVVDGPNAEGVRACLPVCVAASLVCEFLDFALGRWALLLFGRDVPIPISI